jgi:ribosomal protein S7
MGLGELMIEILNEDGSTTMTFKTYASIMRERYDDGKRETAGIVYGAIDTVIDRTMDENELTGLLHAKEIIKEALRAHSPKSVD